MDDGALLPSPIDVDFYDQHGWWIAPKVFSDDEVADAAQAVQRYYAGERDAQLAAPINRYLNWEPDEADRRLAKDDYVLQQSNALRRLGMSPVVGAIAARLAHTEEIRLFSSSLIRKPPSVNADVARVGWHVDRAYWQTCTSQNMLTAWIPLHDCDAEMGTITMVDRSHRWPETPAVRALRAGTTFISDDVASIERDLSALGLEIEWVPMSLKSGQVSFHNCLTVHGSDINRSRAPRITLTVHLQDERNAYREVYKPNGQLLVHNTDRLVRRRASGEPDYRDPAICPVIWRAALERPAERG
jgi:ectoine hydroxylase-related dioxygenase (phytanoyl-CoA dioxygenase family)